MRPDQTQSFDPLSLSQFAKQIRTTFKIREGLSKAVQLELVQVETWPRQTQAAEHHPAVGNVSFLLRFSGSPHRPLRQSTYVFEHRKMGSFAMFIIPDSSVNPEKIYYSALFNKLGSSPKTRSNAVAILS
jgi:hypothetical protein